MITFYLYSSGLSKELCKMEVLGKTVITISKNGDQYTTKTETPGLPTKEITYRLGEPFDAENYSGKKYKVSQALFTY